MTTSKMTWCFLMLLAALAVAGCVTESTGGMPEPASKADRVKAQLDLARGYLEAGNRERARITLNRTLEIDSRAVEAHTLLGVLNEAEGEFALAERHYKTALSIDSKNAQALNNYGSFLYNRGRYEESVVRLRTLVKNPDYRARSQAYENLGLAELKLEEKSEARESFSRALQLSFAQPRSSLELAAMAYEDKTYDLAREYYDGFRTQAQQTPRSLCLGMKISQAIGNIDAMASYALALNNLYPNSREAQQCVVPK